MLRLGSSSTLTVTGSCEGAGWLDGTAPHPAAAKPAALLPTSRLGSRPSTRRRLAAVPLFFSLISVTTAAPFMRLAERPQQVVHLGLDLLQRLGGRLPPGDHLATERAQHAGV